MTFLQNNMSDISGPNAPIKSCLLEFGHAVLYFLWGLRSFHPFGVEVLPTGYGEVFEEPSMDLLRNTGGFGDVVESPTSSEVTECTKNEYVKAYAFVAYRIVLFVLRKPVPITGLVDQVTV
jgi:hypothetical protein